MSSRNVYLTAITKETYVRGVLALLQSLKNSKSKHQLVVLVTTEISEESRTRIRNLGLAGNDASSEKSAVVVRDVEKFKLPEGVPTNYAFERFLEAWTKLEAWKLDDDYEKICWLDADMLVLRNMDEIFDYLVKPEDRIGSSHACVCNSQKNPNYPEWWTPNNCYYTQSESSTTTQRYFNAGLLLFRPSKSEYKRFSTYLQEHPSSLAAYTFAEQDFLNEFYHNEWIVLPSIYNSLKTFKFMHPKFWDLEKVKNIHYILDKPWDVIDRGERQEGDDKSEDLEGYGQIIRMWWSVYESID